MKKKRKGRGERLMGLDYWLDIYDALLVNRTVSLLLAFAPGKLQLLHQISAIKEHLIIWLTDSDTVSERVDAFTWLYHIIGLPYLIKVKVDFLQNIKLLFAFGT